MLGFVVLVWSNESNSAPSCDFKTDGSCTQPVDNYNWNKELDTCVVTVGSYTCKTSKGLCFGYSSVFYDGDTEKSRCYISSRGNIDEADAKGHELNQEGYVPPKVQNPVLPAQLGAQYELIGKKRSRSGSQQVNSVHGPSAVSAPLPYNR